MMGWHRHQWNEVARTATQRISGLSTACSEHLAERLICGVTTILFRCAIPGCVATRSVEMLGQQIEKGYRHD